ELFQNGQVIDTFGELEHGGAGLSWSYLDSYAYRLNRTGPSGTLFDESVWNFGGSRALDGKTASEQGAIVSPIFGTFVADGEDRSALTLVAEPSSFSEAGGDQAARITLHIDSPLEIDLIIHLVSSDPDHS